MINTLLENTPPLEMLAVDNYYDICVNGKLRVSKQAQPPIKRNPSTTTRPSDYYVKKLLNCLLSDELVQLLSTGTRFLLASNDLSGEDDEIDLYDEAPAPLPKRAPLQPVLKRHTLMPALRHQNSMPQIPLNRTKSRYLLAGETRDRQQFRKKTYDENDTDDVILELHQLFNVPVLKNYGDLYKHTHTFCEMADNKYPAPKLAKPEDEIIGTPLSNISEHGDVSFDDDDAICRNLSHFYTERSVSQLKLAKLSRDHHAMYKLPTYVRLQLSVDDLYMISPEKLEVLHQSRPINLPPKLTGDKLKHQRQFNRVLTSFEGQLSLSVQTSHELRVHSQNLQQKWLRMVAGLRGAADYHAKFDQQKNEIRKLAWDVNPPALMRYQFWLETLLVTPKAVEEIKLSYNCAQAKYLCLDQAAKSQKDAEFDAIIDQALSRPLLKLVLRQSPSHPELRNNFRTLLYLGYFSAHGLHKRDEVFMIPILLVLFEREHSIEEIFVLLELFNTQVFTRELLLFLNRDLNHWGHVSTLPHSYTKGLAKFGDLGEFEGLNSALVFELLCQMDDSLPLLMLAPLTPVVGCHFNFSLSLVELCEGDEVDLAGLQLMVKLLTILIIYSHAQKLKTKNNLKVLQTFMVIVFTYYHINWNCYKEVLVKNTLIRLNNTLDKAQVLELFAEKWRLLFKK